MLTLTAFAMYKKSLKTLFLHQCVQWGKPHKNRSNTDYFVVCPKITHSSILLAMPVAFIYTFLLKLQIVLLLSVKKGDLYCIDLLFPQNVVYVVE